MVTLRELFPLLELTVIVPLQILSSSEQPKQPPAFSVLFTVTVIVVEAPGAVSPWPRVHYQPILIVTYSPT